MREFGTKFVRLFFLAAGVLIAMTALSVRAADYPAPLDAGRYFVILPDALGTGKSTRPSAGANVGAVPCATGK